MNKKSVSKGKKIKKCKICGVKEGEMFSLMKVNMEGKQAYLCVRCFQEACLGRGYEVKVKKIKDIPPSVLKRLEEEDDSAFL
jgi:hypothetical protein